MKKDLDYRTFALTEIAEGRFILVSSSLKNTKEKSYMDIRVKTNEELNCKSYDQGIPRVAAVVFCSYFKTYYVYPLNDLRCENAQIKHAEQKLLPSIKEWAKEQLKKDPCYLKMDSELSSF